MASRLLNTMGISVQKLYIDLLASNGRRCIICQGRDAKPQRWGGSSTPALDSFSRNLTQMALDENWIRWIGREHEIRESDPGS